MIALPPSLANSKVLKRSIKIAGHATSVSLEQAFWNALKEIASARNLSINSLIGQIDFDRSTNKESPPSNLSSAVRVFVLRNRPF